MLFDASHYRLRAGGPHHYFSLLYVVVVVVLPLHSSNDMMQWPLRADQTNPRKYHLHQGILLLAAAFFVGEEDDPSVIELLSFGERANFC